MTNGMQIKRLFSSFSSIIKIIASCVLRNKIYFDPMSLEYVVHVLIMFYDVHIHPQSVLYFTTTPRHHHKGIFLHSICIISASYHMHSLHTVGPQCLNFVPQCKSKAFPIVSLPLTTIS
jgi:hypothetical protein